MGSEPGPNEPAGDRSARADSGIAVAAAVAAEPTLPVASVARRLGVAPSTLRTWDRRYGVGPSRHTGGRHRRYGPADIGRLELMQRALLSGASTAEAARYALARMPKCAPAESARPAPAPPPTMALRVDTPDGAVVLPAEEPADGAGLGPSRFARRLSAAALAMDVHTVQRLLAEAIAAEGVLVTWEEIVEPVLAALARRDRVGAAGVEVEHMLAECVLAALVRATPVPAEPRNRRPVLLGCVPEERNGLPLYALAAGLAERRLLAQLFGSPMPADTLAVAVRRSLPAAVVLWAARPGADPRLFTRLARGRQRSRLFACGSGWDAATLPAKVELLGDLPAAVDRLEYVLLGHP